MGQKVAVVGASPKPARFSYRAFKMLKEFGHEPLLVSPKLGEIEGTKVFGKLSDLQSKVDTLTMYVGPDISTKMENEILNLKPARVIFNPGSENPALEKNLTNAGIHVIEACTLVLLQTDEFDKA